ncbi:MAG: glycosyltransferase family 2 protein [Pirellulaceae bacterium]|nr:glycosyltransferase family 2 protein [Pirellulaceae bacterium]
MRRWLAALPVYNEEQYLDGVLAEVFKYAPNVLVVDDGSSDGTAQRLKAWPNVQVVRHPHNRGYGAALKTAFQFAIEQDYECLVTLDCDGQHQPQRIPRFVAASQHADIVSGSRYLKQYSGDSTPPSERLFINRQVTRDLNELLQCNLTDAFCGFKAYRVSALKQLKIQDDGYAMPLEVWVQAAMLGLSVIEVPVPLIYLDLNRSFGGALDNGQQRLNYYRQCIHQSVQAMQERGFELPKPRRLLQQCSE